MTEPEAVGHANAAQAVVGVGVVASSQLLGAPPIDEAVGRKVQ
jgi:hypothetical protein